MEAPTHWPWPADMRKVWLPGPPDRWGRRTSVRDDKLWHEMHRNRLAGEVAAARQWLYAAEQDGWKARPTYKHELVTEAFTCERDGFKIQGLARIGDDPDKPHGSMPHGSITMWCDRRINVSPLPIVYPGWDAIKALTRRCPECGSEDVPTYQVAFANRCCASCLPGLRAKLERPGWCD